MGLKVDMLVNWVFGGIDDLIWIWIWVCVCVWFCNNGIISRNENVNPREKFRERNGREVVLDIFNFDLHSNNLQYISVVNNNESELTIVSTVTNLQNINYILHYIKHSIYL
ncbi:hypothetical protein ACOSQ2_005892 [Xanthoceras sorbifolium]